MKSFLGKFGFPPTKTHAKKRQKAKAQSLVEFAVTIPILMLLLLGMVEFGFMLNTYLSLQDAIRNAGRRYSTISPFLAGGDIDTNFFANVAQYVVEDLAPPDEPAARQIPFNSSRDNVLVSLIEAIVDDTGTISVDRRPAGTYYRLYSDTTPASQYTDSAVETLLKKDGATPISAGLLTIEVFYGYTGVLNTPFTRPFMSPTNPMMLYASVAMPTVYAKPFPKTPTPSP
ncbi:MAG: pilus assembly protein [Anaerolineales bacterium]|nr:pilus assembly protein [Anaerolineales bacterium]